MEKKSIRVAYGEAIVKLAAKNDQVVVLDADLAAATMTQDFKKTYPERFYDCGIAEANMVDMAAGMSTMGLIPFCSTFAVFAGRSYDQIRNGVCYPKLNVKLGFSHAGITLGEDGCYLKTADVDKYFPASSFMPVDTTGGGDAFIAALVSYLSEGYSLDQAIRIANYAAGFCISHPGAASALVDKLTLETYISKLEPELLNHDGNYHMVI